jgi:flagellar basal-body rod protein FlgG
MAVHALNSSATGLSALSTQLDVIANNLANVNTNGYKASRANFQDLLYIEKEQPGVRNANGDQRPTGLYLGLGVKVSGTQQNFEQGPVQPTGNELDLMIDGEGFFKVRVSEEVAPGGVAYTRAGNFTLNAEGKIVLANDQGPILDPEISIEDTFTKISISPDGRVMVGLNGEPEPQEAGQIELVKFINPAGLEQLGDNLWAETVASGTPIEGEAGTDGRGEILQNMLEGSNVDPMIELVKLIETQRAFELNSQAIKAADQLLQQVSNLRRS